MKLEFTPKPTHSDVKRYYLPGECKVSVTCPHCGEGFDREIDDYLSYPEVNAPEEYSFTCPKCEEEIAFKIQIDVSVRLLGMVEE